MFEIILLFAIISVPIVIYQQEDQSGLLMGLGIGGVGVVFYNALHRMTGGGVKNER